MSHALYTAAQTRELDNQAIQGHDIPGITLMERAGQACFQQLKLHWPEAEKITVFCGLGNNAGDGYVIARLAHEQAMKVSVIQIGDSAALKGDAKLAQQALLDSGLTPAPYAEELPVADVYVDALLGTGLDRNVEGNIKQVIVKLNASAVPCLSADIPTGLHADSGRVMGVCVQADVTVTFIGRKRGLYTGAAADYCGTIVFDDLQVPAEIYQSVPADSELITIEQFDSVLQPRSRIAHKGEYGHVLIIGGDHGYSGAARMAAEAALRSGAGLVSVATRQQHAQWLNAIRPELMCHAVEQGSDLAPLLTKASVIAIGPGLGQSDWSNALLGQAIDSNLPMVVDADALNLLAKEATSFDDWILTPHPGEAARLLDVTTAEIQMDRFAAAEQLQDIYGGTVLLKGSGTIITDATRQHFVCADGNPGMASGGMGDVLTGIIAGLRAQHFNQSTAAQVGACVHASAADQAASVAGERGLLASDLFPHIRRFVNPDIE